MVLTTFKKGDLDTVEMAPLPSLTPLRLEARIMNMSRENSGMILQLTGDTRQRIIALVEDPDQFRQSIKIQDSLLMAHGPIAHELVTEARTKTAELFKSYRTMHLGVIAPVTDFEIPRARKKYNVTVSRLTGKKESLVAVEKRSGLPITMDIADGSQFMAVLDPADFPKAFASGASHAIFHGDKVDLLKRK